MLESVIRKCLHDYLNLFNFRLYNALIQKREIGKVIKPYVFKAKFIIQINYKLAGLHSKAQINISEI